MIDLHSHILPAIDDGAPTMEVSLEMARIAVADGTTHLACTPHILQGVYENTPAGIDQSVKNLRLQLEEHAIDLQLIVGADIHIAVDLADKLVSGSVPCLGDSHYFLFEPPHTIAPPGILALCEKVMDRGFTPVLTHPERLSWIENHYETICQLDQAGLVVQLTAGSITGAFGNRALYWSERMLDEGRVDIIASDAHNTRGRSPGLSKARDLVARNLGDDNAHNLVVTNPKRILEDLPVLDKHRKTTSRENSGVTGILSRVFGRNGRK